MSFQIYIFRVANKINAVMLERKDILYLIGGGKNIQMMKDNNNDVCFIAYISETPNVVALVDRYLWTFRAHMSRGFSSNYWVAQINT